MPTSIIKPVNSAQKSPTATGYNTNQRGTQGSKTEILEDERSLSPAPPVFADKFCPVLFSGQKKESEDEKYNLLKVDLRALLKIIEESNRKIRDMAEKVKPREAKSKITPPTLGYSLSTAAAKLRIAGVKLSGVAQEYSNNVPQGHVIKQIPGPGSPIGRIGVRLVISKGPPPEKEKHDTIRNQEKVPYMDRRPKHAKNRGENGNEDSAASFLHASQAERPLPGTLPPREESSGGETPAEGFDTGQ